MEDSTKLYRALQQSTEPINITPLLKKEVWFGI